MTFGRSTSRLVVLRVLVLSLLVTLGARLYYLQVLDRHKLVQTANDQHVREVILPAPRGAIVDDTGAPLAKNRTSLVVSVNRGELIHLPDQGRAMLKRLAPLVKIPAAQLEKQITPCGPDVPKPCWNGSPYQPVPVATDTTPQVVLHIEEHREDFPGVNAETQTLRAYPGHQLAAHTLGYVGPVTQEELDNAAALGRTDLHDTDLVGRTGLEEQYDSVLRGTSGVRRVKVDNRGTVMGLASETPAAPGDTLVTSIDRNVQSVAEKALSNVIQQSRQTFDPKSGHNYAATSGAAVVMDPRTGRIVALASYPSYDPTVFVGGISQNELNALTSTRAGVPLVSRATQGQFAPGSTFKLVTSSSIVMDGQAQLDGNYSCPGSMMVGNRPKTNFDSESISGPVSLRTALAKSCDTFFYKFAIDAWARDQAEVDAHKKPDEFMQKMAKAYGFGTQPEIDLPDGQQSSGRIADRGFKQQRWDQQKAQYCSDAKRGYPEVTDATRRTFLTKLAKENCTDGWRYRVGDHADLSIGQGETTVSPLQLAVAYSALVNGGTIWAPTIGRAVVDSNGRVVREIKPRRRGKVPVRQDVLDYVRGSLEFGKGLAASGEVAFTGFPEDKVRVGGKTGTAEVFGKQDTSWFASWAPSSAPHFVVVGMVEQAGLGSRAAAPMVRQIYEGIYGLNGHKPALARSTPPLGIPKVRAYEPPPAPRPTNSAHPSGSPSPSGHGTATGTGTASPNPSGSATGGTGGTSASPTPTPQRFVPGAEGGPALPPDRTTRSRGGGT